VFILISSTDRVHDCLGVTLVLDSLDPSSSSLMISLESVCKILGGGVLISLDPLLSWTAVRFSVDRLIGCSTLICS
jgi:hypothetical protein